MSRIHEALQQAERDRLAGHGAETIPAAVVAPQATADATPVLPDSTPTPAATAATLPPVTDPGPKKRAADRFLDSCRKPEWSPDAKSMLFFTTEGARGSEQFRTLRSHLYSIRDSIREKQPLKKLLITSALPGEGKSFIAANLAQVIVCQQGRRALLIDADLRKSTLHQALGAPDSPGLSDYLNGSADERTIIQRAPLEGLCFVPGGTVTRKPAELIATPKMPALLGSMAEHFDWIVIDCPPCIPVADASIIASHCDGVLLVIEAGATPQDTALKAKQQFKDKWLIGVVLNRAADNHRYSSYYYGAYGTQQGSATTKA